MKGWTAGLLNTQVHCSTSVTGVCHIISVSVLQEEQEQEGQVSQVCNTGRYGSCQTAIGGTGERDR